MTSSVTAVCPNCGGYGEDMNWYTGAPVACRTCSGSGEVVIQAPHVYVYAWGNNERRAHLKGRLCRIVAAGTRMHSVEVEFENGERVVTSMRALRKAKS